MSYDAIFIVGTGRSGTHYSCRCLLDFENVTDYNKKEISSLSALTKFSDTLSIEQLKDLKKEEEKFFG